MPNKRVMRKGEGGGEGRESVGCNFLCVVFVFLGVILFGLQVLLCFCGNG